MNKTLSLIKTELNITFGLTAIKHSFKQKKNRWTVVLIAIALLSLIPSYFMLVKGLNGLYDGFRQIGQQSYFLMLGFMVSQVAVLVFGLLYVMSKYYFSNDIVHLVPLPIKPSQIVGSKFASLMVSEYITSLPLILPFIIIYGMKSYVGITYWIFSIIAVLALPILPLVIASILIMAFMKYTNIRGKKDLIRTISAVVFIIFVVYFQLMINRITARGIADGENFLFNLARDANLLVNTFGKMWPPGMWGTFALVDYSNFSGILNLLLFVAIGILGFILMIYLSEKIFFDGLIGNTEQSSNKGKGRAKDSTKNLNVNKPYVALAKKELIMLFKTPIYLMNSIGGVIIVPVIMAMSLFTGGEDMAPIRALISDNSSYVVLGGIGFIAVMGILNSIGVTTFSREGNNFWIQRIIPVLPRDQIIGRVLASLIVQLLAAAFIIGSIFFIARISVIDVLAIVIIGLLASIPMTMMGMTIDILRPMRNWTNPQQAMKQNLNVLIGLAVGSLYIGALGFLVFKLVNRISLSLILAAIAGVLLLTMILLYIVLEKLIFTQFQEIED